MYESLSLFPSLPLSLSLSIDIYIGWSFNHMLLIYIPKHIHFSTKIFIMRMNLAVLDWVGFIVQQFIQPYPNKFRMIMPIGHIHV